ncbi:Uncharacterized protein FWK35_00027321 [Aphis craccivora]|uniref:Uncharacterized protein n=1 Tax=Aphis craccivora TaxID=307492 RepID=A0A6G0VLM0_APHCR|nr:Uncharacterized protein FWK35_00027321 [Aphis craccivora]
MPDANDVLIVPTFFLLRERNIVEKIVFRLYIKTRHSKIQIQQILHKIKCIVCCLHINNRKMISGNNSERSDECIDFTMIITSRNNDPISNYGGGFRCKSKKLTFSNSFQKNREKQKKKMTEKREFLRKTNF